MENYHGKLFILIKQFSSNRTLRFKAKLLAIFLFKLLVKYLLSKTVKSLAKQLSKQTEQAP